MRELRIIIFIILCSVSRLSAQYYSWGADAPQKWSTMEGDRVSVIYPDTTSELAHRVMCYINAVQPYIATGYEKPALDLPFIIHPENFASNGLVMWMPKRIEFISTPPAESYSMLWNKQLVAHEYRHAVQYNNINQGWVKILSYILGQQGSIVGFAFMPLYGIEGDAVYMETQMSSYGRALQPNFSIAYRALGDDTFSGKNKDKWYCGSYKEFIPDHYAFGYQFSSYAYTKYNENIWDKTVPYLTRRPYMIFANSAGLRKYYNTTTDELAKECFDNLNNYWTPLLSRKNSTTTISKIDPTNYTTYSYPMVIESGDVLSIKRDFDTPSRFVINSNDGSEEVVRRIGNNSSIPSYKDGRVWWTEYRRSALYEQKIGSQLCYMDIDDRKIHDIKGVKNAQFPTPMESRDEVAYVEYAPSGRYRVVVRNMDRELRELTIPALTEIHGLAWDNTTHKLYIIATDNSGMWLGEEQNGGFKQLHRGRYITLSSLRAKDGVLYFGSIESGLDELHSYDIKSGVERQVTSSKYGSFQPSTPVDGYIYGTTYDRYGYHLSSQRVDNNTKIVKAGITPTNLVNPERKKLNVINLDSVDYEGADSINIANNSPAKRYSKGGHLVDIHSWAPVRYNPFEILDEQTFNIGWGATILSQNKLSSGEGFLSYGYDRVQGSILNSGYTYSGLGVRLSAGVSYGGYRPTYTFEKLPKPQFSKRDYLSLSAMATLPLYFQRGNKTKVVTLSTGWNYSNGAVLDMEEFSNPNRVLYNIGLHKLAFGAGYGNYTNKAYRDIETPFGYTLSANYSLNPINREFCDLLATYAEVILPGFAPHNSLSLKLNYQNNIGGFSYDGYSPLGYSAAYLIPRGYSTSNILNENYLATSIDYKLPVWYPDGGIERFLYFKRVSLEVGFDYAQFDSPYGGINRLYSMGGGLMVDFNVLRLPSSGTTQFKFAIYKPHNRTLHYEVGLAVPF